MSLKTKWNTFVKELGRSEIGSAIKKLWTKLKAFREKHPKLFWSGIAGLIGISVSVLIATLLLLAVAPLLAASGSIGVALAAILIVGTIVTSAIASLALAVGLSIVAADIWDHCRAKKTNDMIEKVNKAFEDIPTTPVRKDGYTKDQSTFSLDDSSQDNFSPSPKNSSKKKLLDTSPEKVNVKDLGKSIRKGMGTTTSDKQSEKQGKVSQTESLLSKDQISNQI